METNTIILMAGLSFMLFILGTFTAIELIVYKRYVHCSLRFVDTLCWMVYDIFSGILLGLVIFSYFFFQRPLKESILTILLSILAVILLTVIIALLWKRIYKRTYFKRNLKKTEKIMASRKRLDEIANELASNIPVPSPKTSSKTPYKKRKPTSSADSKVVYLNRHK